MIFKFISIMLDVSRTVFKKQGYFLFQNLNKKKDIFKFVRCGILYTMFMQNLMGKPNLKELMQNHKLEISYAQFTEAIQKFNNF